MSFRKIIKKTYFRFLQKTGLGTDIDSELSIIGANPRFNSGYTNIFGKPFKYHDGKSFVATYNELFKTNIYRFIPSKDKFTILDCGANMGLSVLYFAMNYPNHKIIAFEPDPSIFKVLKENVETFRLNNVIVYEKAVWDKHETLSFFTDEGMGGRVENSYANQEPNKIEAVPLRDYLTEDIDFLKIDIEGAEEVVLSSCKDVLSRANHIFFEYHNNIHTPQTLHKLLEMIASQGFTYYIKESDIRKKPFIDEHIICETFDMALNVFCYKKNS